MKKFIDKSNLATYISGKYKGNHKITNPNK